jgi:hypothetical protein
MGKLNRNISLQSFRFHRWSRVGYAVFRSLSMCITIGKLSSDICEKAFFKLKGISQQLVAFVSLEKNIAEDENPDEWIEQNQLEQVLIINYTTKLAVATAMSLVLCFHSFVFCGWNKNFSYFNRFFI